MGLLGEKNLRLKKSLDTVPLTFSRLSVSDIRIFKILFYIRVSEFLAIFGGLSDDN
jgi:hypothetical protein